MTSKAERRENARLLADALLEAFERKYDDALASAADIELSDTAPISFERIYARISSQRRRKTAMLVAAVLAALMLCGCTAYVYREKLAGFIMEYTPVGINIDLAAASSTASDDIPCYTFTVLPEGYKSTHESHEYLQVIHTWKNERLCHTKWLIFS